MIRRNEGILSALGAIFIIVNAALGAGLLTFPFAFYSAGGVIPGMAIQTVGHSWCTTVNYSVTNGLIHPLRITWFVCPRGCSKLALSWGAQWDISLCWGVNSTVLGGKLLRWTVSRGGGLLPSWPKGPGNLVICRGCTLINWNSSICNIQVCPVK